MEQIEKIEALKHDAGFMKKLAELEDAAQIKALFQENGVEINEDELKAAMEQGASDEIGAEELDNVSGGLVDPVGLVFVAAAVYTAWSAAKSKKKSKK